MKKTIGLLAMYASLVLVAAPTFANVNEETQTPAPACTAENKLAWYTEFRGILRTDQPKAYELAKKYLACPSEASEQQITDYLKNYVNILDKANRTPQVAVLVYEKKDFAKAFELGRQVLADEPNNVKILIDLSYAGFLAAAARNEIYSTDAQNYARKAIQLIEGGTAVENWAPYASKGDALAYLNNTIGVLMLAKNPSDALPFLIKAAQLEGKLKKQAILYGYIGDAYQSGPYEKLSADYKAKFEGKDESPESKLALENINQVIDRMIDAFARAVSLAGTEAANQANKKIWMDALTTWYKYRHQSDAELPNYIASVMSKPLPPVPTPITTLPAAAPTTTTPNSGVGAINAAGNGTAPKTGGAASTSPTATTTPASATGAGAAPAKPKPRNNHRRR